MNERLDLVLFGATGFTGKYCIEAIYELATPKHLTWGISGRSKEKLQKLLDDIQQKIGKDLSHVPIIVADVNDEESLNRMAASAKVVINCCGPYRLFGEPVVKACIEAGTHQVDVAGEPQYMEYIQYKYHDAAREKGIYIISACGFDSIPADLGVLFLYKMFGGTLNSVEIYMQSSDEAQNQSGPVLSFATWESAVLGIGHAKSLTAERKKMTSTRLPTFKPKLEQRPPGFKSDLVNAWTIPFIGADRSVIYRTQRYLYEYEKIRPVQVRSYHMVESAFSVVLIDIYKNIFTYLARYGWGRSLLLTFPGFFSGGLFSHESPTEEKIKNTKFKLTFLGRGWDTFIPSTERDFKKPENKVVVSRVCGTNPGYGMTTTACTLSAIVVLTESDKLPQGGGVYTPGGAFFKTTLIEQLQRNGLSFEVKSKL